MADGPIGIPDLKASEPGQPVARNPRVEYVVSGPWAGFTPSGGYLIASAIDDVVRQFGPWVYELMRLDPAISGSLNLLYAGILAEGLQVSPAEVAAPGEVVSQRKRKRELRLAEQVADYWHYCLERLQPGIDQVLWEMLDEALTGGCTVAEPVFELAEDGPWRGKLVLRTFQVKPRWAWGFRVDPYMRVQRLRCWTVEGWRDVDRAHFVHLAWQPRTGDPRGTRILRPAYPAWNFKLQAIPDYSEYLKHFADPSLVLTAGENSQPVEVVDPNTGARTLLSVQQQLVQAGQAFRNRSVLGLEYGATATFLSSQGNGEAYLKGFDWSDREIFRSIIIGARPLQEAKFGSKADTESGMDLVQMAVQSGRRPLGEAIRRDLLWTGTMLNWGRDVADRSTPRATFGLADHLSPALMAAFADAWQKGLFAAPQRPWLLDKLGAPQDPAPDPDAPSQPNPQPRQDGEQETPADQQPAPARPKKPRPKPKAAA